MQRQAEALGLSWTSSSSDRSSPAVPGTTGTPAASATARAATLSPSGAHGVGRWPDPDESRLRARARRTTASSARKPYPGCTASAPASTAGLHERRRVEVGRDARRGVAELGGERGFLAGSRGHDRGDAHLAAGAHDADRDLAAVRDQEPADLDHLGGRFSRNAARPSCPSALVRAAGDAIGAGRAA